MGNVDRQAAAEAALTAELQRLVDSGEYDHWLAATARFHRYSPANARLIVAQAPHATRVASYRTWAELGRHVRRGETGIAIYHPKPYWIDPTSGEKVRPPRTDTERARAVRKIAYGTGYVFDVSQTDGRPLPELGRPAPADAPRALVEHLERWCDTHGITIDHEPLPPGLDGYYQRDRDRIVLDTTATSGARAATLAHELAHRHDPELLRAEATGDRRYYAHHRPDCEAVAEATAHALAGRFGLDLTSPAAGYIASWVDGDVTRLTALHDRIGQVTRTLIPPDQLDRAIDTAAQQRPEPHQRSRADRPRPAARR